MSDEELHDEGRKVILDALTDLARAEGYLDSCYAQSAVLMGTVIDRDGVEHIVGRWTGGYVSALGLVEHAKHQLLEDEDEDED